MSETIKNTTDERIERSDVVPIVSCSASTDSVRPRVLIACEESGTVREAMASVGCDAWSCDIQPTRIAGQHLQCDVREILNDGWDLLIAHPPCTYLTVTGNRWFKPEYAGRYPTRQQDRQEAIEFFMALANAPIDKIAIENPVCIMSSVWRKANQVIQPWQFGDKAVKKTCLWLKGLPPLLPTEIVEPEYKTYNSSTKKSGKSRYPMLWAGKKDSKERSKTFDGIARAMADQWGRQLVGALSKQKHCN